MTAPVRASSPHPFDREIIDIKRYLFTYFEFIFYYFLFFSLFFNENRTIREVADFMHLAKSTVSSVVQVFKKEHRIQRKTSTGRRKKLSDEHEALIMDMVSQKEDITIEETRNRLLTLYPDIPGVSKSTIYRIMENCQSKMVSD